MKKELLIQKFEPEDGKIIHGAGQSQEQFKKYWDTVGKYKPLIYMTYVRINEVREKLENELNELNSVNSGLIPQIGLNLKVKEKGQQCVEITIGHLDKEILFLINILKNLKKPVFLRIGYEFNNPTNNYHSKEFIGAWKHIVDLFRKENCDNVAFVWCACTGFDSESESIERIMKYYPGDEYVDWFGNDLFGVKHFKDNQDAVTEAFAKESDRHNKPLMIGESSAAKVGVLNGEKSWKEWFEPFFEWLHKHPVTKAFCYINWDWGEDWKTPEWGM